MVPVSEIWSVNERGERQSALLLTLNHVGTAEGKLENGEMFRAEISHMPNGSILITTHRNDKLYRQYVVAVRDVVESIARSEDV